MVLRLFGIGGDRSWTYAMMSSGFPLEGVVGGLWGSTACASRLELAGTLSANAGSGTVLATEDKDFVLGAFLDFSFDLIWIPMQWKVQVEANFHLRQ